MPPAPLYRFGEFTLDSDAFRLTRGTADVPLTPKAFELLVLLVRERRRGLTKQQLLDAVWGETAVTENTLTQRIKEIREALGDTPYEPTYIRTIARVGYQFVGQVTEEVGPREVAGFGGQREVATQRLSPIRLVPAGVGSAERLPIAEPDDVPDAASVAEPPAAAPPPEVRRRLWNRQTWAVALVLLAGGAAGLSVYLTGGARHVTVAGQQFLFSTFDGSHRSPSFSPDGAMLAYLMDVDGVPQVWVRPVGAGSAVQITSGPIPAQRPRWSPGGDQIVFERQSGIWSVPPLGGTARLLVEPGRSPNFSADGSTIVFERGPPSHRWGLWLAAADGTNIREVPGVPDKPVWSEPTFPALSPDGQWIAFFRHSLGPRGDLWIVRAAGGGARRLTTDEREGGAPTWTSDGTGVILPSERRGSRTLWRVGLSGEVQTLTAGAGVDDEPGISPDGSRLVYANRRDQSSLISWDPVSGRSQTLAESASVHWLPEVSPKDDRIAFFANVAGDMQIFRINRDGTDLRQLTFGTRQDHMHPSWSPDGSATYYYSRRTVGENGHSGWRRMSVDGRADTEVAAGWQWQTHSYAGVDRSGRYALYTRVHSDTGEYARDTTYIRDLRTGDDRAVEAPHLHAARWSPDGRQLAGQRHDGSVALCEAASGRCHTLLKGTRPVWCRDGEHIYFQRDVTPTSATVWRIDLSTGREEQLGPIGPFHPLSPAIGVTADHRIVFSSVQVGRSTLWVMDLGGM
jgi:Tol biopolymer transport system component/DNA-binding winged helix-turn-helix (wHTH) protein